MKTKRWVAVLLCVMLIGSLFPVSALATDESEENTASVGTVEETAAPEPRQETEPEPQTDKTASAQDTFGEESTGRSSEDTETGGQALESVEIIHDGNEPNIAQNDVPAELGNDGFTASPATPSDAMPKSAFVADIPSDTGWYLDADGVLHITGDIPESGFNLTDEQKQQVKSAVAESGASISSGKFLFDGFENMTSADLNLLNTTGVTDMSYMFNRCSSLTSLDVSGFDTRSVSIMNQMFSGCSSLTSLDVSGFKTDSIAGMYNMFCGCSALTSLGIRPDILYKNADDIIAIRSPWQKKGSTDTYSTADELKAVTDTVILLAMYTVNVQNDGNGTASANPAAAVEGDTVTLTATPNNGYYFKEWQSTDVTVTDNKFTMPAKAVTVTAVFEAIPTYTVTFEMNGHGTQVAGQTVEDGNKATKPDNPAASGWTFGGWYADATFSAKFDFNTAITANTTIYAKWTENTTSPAPTYTMIAGMGGEWTEGSMSGLSFTSDAPFAKFDSVQVDGSTIAAANYTAEEGSTKITLAPAYLETLSVGSHSIKIVSKDGSASTSFRIKAAPQPTDPTSPKTGDNSHLLLWVLLLAASGAVLTGTVIYSRKKKHG